jgi:hypothetical protein
MPPPYAQPPQYGQPPRPPPSLVPQPGTEAAVASIVFALGGQSEKRRQFDSVEMEKLGAGLQDLSYESNQMLSAIRPDMQRAQLFFSLIQDARGDAEEIRRKRVEIGRDEQALQAKYQRILDEGLPMISGVLDPSRVPPGAFTASQPRHIAAADPAHRTEVFGPGPAESLQGGRPQGPPREPLPRAVPRRPVVNPGAAPGPAFQRPVPVGPPIARPPRAPVAPNRPAPSPVAAYSGLKRKEKKVAKTESPAVNGTSQKEHAPPKGEETRAEDEST